MTYLSWKVLHEPATPSLLTGGRIPDYPWKGLFAPIGNARLSPDYAWIAAYSETTLPLLVA